MYIMIVWTTSNLHKKTDIEFPRGPDKPSRTFGILRWKNIPQVHCFPRLALLPYLSGFFLVLRLRSQHLACRWPLLTFEGEAAFNSSNNVFPGGTLEWLILWYCWWKLLSSHRAFDMAHMISWKNSTFLELVSVRWRKAWISYTKIKKTKGPNVDFLQLAERHSYLLLLLRK